MFQRWLTLSPPTLEIHHQLQAVEALHILLKVITENHTPEKLNALQTLTGIELDRAVSRTFRFS
jgi:hypothetical protein